MFVEYLNLETIESANSLNTNRGETDFLSILKNIQKFCQMLEYNMQLLQEIRFALNQLSKPGNNSISKLDSVCREMIEF